MSTSAGTAYLQIRPDLSAVTSQVGAYLAGSRFSKFGKVAGAGIAAGIVAGGAAKALYDLGAAFDESYDKIRVGTGKTGKQLKGLEGDFKAVLKSVPADFDSAAEAITGLNQRLEITGKPLRALSKQLTELSRITETDVGENVQSVTRLFGDWSVKTEDQSKTLDGLFRLTQKTGSTVGELSDSMVQFGAPLRNLGFGMDSAAAMFANFEESGVNMTTVMSGLRLSVGNLAEKNPELAKTFRDLDISTKSPEQTIGDLFETIVELDQRAATALGIQVFGKRAGPDLVDTVRGGKFALDDLIGTFEHGDETIRKAGKSTMDFGEQWTLLKNNVLVGLEPLATRVFKGVGDAMKKVTDILTDKKLSGGQKFNAIADMFTEAIGNAAEKALPIAVNAGAKVMGALGTGFVSAWRDANPLTKVLLGAAAIRLIGGKGALLRSGTMIGGYLGAGVSAGAAATAAGTGAAAGGGLIATMRAKVLPFAKRAGLVGVGLTLADGVISEFGRRASERSGELFEELGSKASGTWDDALNKLSPFDQIFGEGMDFTDKGEQRAKDLETQLRGVLATDKLITAERATQLKDQGRIVGLTTDARQEMGKLLDSITSKQPTMTGFGFANALAKDGNLASGEIDKMIKNLGELPPAHRKEAANSMIGMAAILEAKGKLPKGAAERLRIAVIQSAHNMNVRSVHESRKQAVGVAQNMVALSTAVAGGLQWLAAQTNKSLLAYGVKPLNFAIEHPKAAGKVVGAALGGGLGGLVGSVAGAVGRRMQEGGMVVPGSGSGDKVPVGAMVEPHERLFVLNRNAAAAYQRWNEMFPRFQKGGVAGMSAMIAEANKFEDRHFPYVLGGGHGSFGIQPVDCSGAVSDVLHAAGLLGAPMVSGALASWGEPGKGPLTVYANPAHTVMSLDGEFFGTSGSNPGGGAGWIEGGFDAGYLSAFAARTMDVAGAAASHIARLILKGPKGPLRSMGQAGLDKARKAANKFISSKMPTGSFGGGQPLADLTGPGKTVGASVYGFGEPGTGTVGASGVSLPGKMAFAELDMGTALGHLPFGAKLKITAPTGKTVVGEKLDIGLGGGDAGGFHRAIDFWQDLAVKLGLGSTFLGAVKVQGLQRGGEILSLKHGGTVPGPIGAPVPAIVHGGERYSGAGGRQPHVEINLYGDAGALLEEVEVLIDGKTPEIAEYTLREGGRNRSRGRQLAGSAGRP